MAAGSVPYQKTCDLVTDLVIGLSDSLIIPFALATGLYRVGLSSNTILMAGISWVAIGSLTVGLGAYFAAKDEIKSALPGEMDSELKIASGIGLDEQTVQLIADGAEKDRVQWEKTKSEYALKISDGREIRRSSINIGVFYFLGGLIPLLPYPVFSSDDSFKCSLAISVIALFLFGFFKGRVTGRSAFKSAIRMVAIGCTTAAVAYFIACLL